MFTTIAIVVAVLIAAFLAYVATKPDVFRVKREKSVNAPPEKIFPMINDFNSWRSWSPWEKLDPELRRTYSGSQSGPGAVYAWEGNDKVGQGRMEILESTPSAKIVIKLDFIKPFEAHNTAEFTLAPDGDTTKVTWTMSAPCNYLMKIMHCFIDIDKMCGKDFEEGLTNMKAVAEK